MFKEIDTSKWIGLIKEYDLKEKTKSLSSNELITQMKRLEGINEINSYIKELLNRNEDGKCLIELCLEDIETGYAKCSSLFEKKIKTKLCDYDEKCIKTWTKLYKAIRKENLKSIYCNEVTELIAVISRASEIVNRHQLRTTQKISLLIFIDSILFNFGGRLANISTGEGKSLITISTAISQILIKGGTVDILTSSEVLAERDAEESKEMFEIFEISVSNNCDTSANSDEKIRKERYEKNVVIYGEIGHFQRDILLTKYYDKDIRKQLASCLIIDEVDSMCIDNMCNTLYISHQIADFRYLKEIYCFIWQGVNAEDASEYTIANVDKVKETIEKLIKEKQINYPSSLSEFISRRLKTWINNAYIAKEQIEEGNHYSIMGSGKKIGEAVINDLQTGVEQLNTQWSEGLQQFIQLKHTNKLTEESLKAIFMSNYIYFKQYCGNVYGMTGTLGASLERDLLSKAYGLDFFQLPRFKKELNIKEEDVLVASRPDWLQEIKKEVNQIVSNNREIDEKEKKEKLTEKSIVANEIASLDAQISKLKSTLEADKKDETKLNELAKLESKRDDKSLVLEDCNDTVGEIEQGRAKGGRAVLIICENKKDVNDIVKALLIKHKHIYDYNGKVDGLRKVVDLHKRTPAKINQLRPSDIIVATNVAGRGTDFKISRLLQENGGLHVVISYVPSNIRVELQGFGRSGRKGENGSGRMIAYDQRAKLDSITMEFLKEERDEREEERLQEIRIKMIPRVTVERELFEKFDKLQKDIRAKFNNKPAKYRDLQMKSLHNKWAYWLDEMSDEINNVYQSNENRARIFEAYVEFEKEMREKVQRSFRGIQELIDEPGELIKLAKYNIEEGNFSDAMSNCDHIINKYGADFCPFSYYYKAIALFKPLKNNDWDQSLDKIRRSWCGHIMTYEEKKDGIDLLKKASILFEQEIERIQMRSYIMSNISKEKVNSGVGSAADYFTKSNVNEITALQVHLNAAKSALSQEITG
jgi:ribosomal protein S15P/S13E